MRERRCLSASPGYSLLENLLHHGEASRIGDEVSLPAGRVETHQRDTTTQRRTEANTEIFSVSLCVSKLGPYRELVEFDFAAAHRSDGLGARLHRFPWRDLGQGGLAWETGATIPATIAASRPFHFRLTSLVCGTYSGRSYNTFSFNKLFGSSEMSKTFALFSASYSDHPIFTFFCTFAFLRVSPINSVL